MIDGPSALMGNQQVPSECLSAGRPVEPRCRWADRKGFGAFPQPLLQQQGRRGAVELAAAVPVQPAALARLPAAAVFIHPGQGQLQGLGQALAVSAAVPGLHGGLLTGIEGQPHHQGLHAALGHQGAQPLEIGGECSPGQWGQGGDGQAERVAAGQTNPPPAHIEGQD